MFATFNENPAMTLQDIKETKRYGRTDARTDNVKTVYPLQTKFAGGITTNKVCGGYNNSSVKGTILTKLIGYQVSMVLIICTKNESNLTNRY